MPRAKCNNVDIEYEIRGHKGQSTILLIMGLGTQLVAWPDTLLDGLVSRGFRVVRFDNRDVGLSSKIEGTETPDIGAAIRDAIGGRPINAPYKLKDMAADTVALLDALDVDTAHVVGISMGGAIAQIIAAGYPDRTRSLVSIMSSSGRPGLALGTPEAMEVLFAPKPPAGDREAAIAHSLKTYRVIGSPGYAMTEADLRKWIARGYDRSYYPAGGLRQLLAILASGSRLELLRRIKAPTLVMHGADDPLVPVEGGIDTADNIAGAKLLVIPGMGHDLAEGLMPLWTNAIAEHCQNADNEAARVTPEKRSGLFG
jgi:pimeloyl-ACP methyl ester carboxylesterase